jgi:octanoyl-[GcvH]:protein N-octanoyltransferase
MLPAEAIALDDVAAARVGRGMLPPMLRLWENQRALVVPAWRLPSERISSVIDRHGVEWPVCPRSSGGAKVAHGPGTLNVSLIQRMRGFAKPAIDDAYRAWSRLVGMALRDAFSIEIESNRIDGAFCSGRYDAAIDGRKLAGTAQTRKNGAVIVHGTILVSVDRVDYAALVGAELDPDRIVSLHEIVENVSCQQVALSIAKTAIERKSEWLD